jgi:hypothetical protein
MRELKDISKLRIVSIAVVNETPGSRREISPDQVWPEIERLRGNPAELHPLNPARRH